MSEQNKNPENPEAGKTPPAADETIIKLQEQIANLNKGIATYRDEAKTAIEAARAATQALETFKEKADAGKSSDVKLTKEEEEKFQAWAKAQGVVTKAELDAERIRIQADSVKNYQQTAVTEFLEKYPEFDDDDMWEKVQAEFNLYKTPVDLAGYKKLLDKIRMDLTGDSKKDRARAEVRAELAKKNALSLGGRGGNGGNDAAAREADIDAMQKRYPNLSRDQIEARLDEVKGLYEKK